MKRFAWIMLVCCGGCLVPPAAPMPLKPPGPINAPIYKAPDPIQVPKSACRPALDSVTVEAGVDAVSSIYKWLGAVNAITLRDKLTLHQTGGQSITIPPGASVEWNLTDSGGVFSFGMPKPVITTFAGPFEIHPTLDRIKLTTPNKGVAEVTELGMQHRKTFVLDWVGTDRAESPTPDDSPQSIEEWLKQYRKKHGIPDPPEPPTPIEVVPEVVPAKPPTINPTPIQPIPEPPKYVVPEMVMYSADWCPACPHVVATMQQAQQRGQLPFTLRVIKDNQAQHVRSFPMFCWSTTTALIKDAPKGKLHWQKGFPGVVKLVEIFEQSRGKPLSKPPRVSVSSDHIAEIAKTYPNRWYQVDASGRTIDTKPDHLTETHGVNYDAIKPFLRNPDALNRIHGWCHRTQVAEAIGEKTHDAQPIANNLRN